MGTITALNPRFPFTSITHERPRRRYAMIAAAVAFGSMISLGVASFLGPLGFLIVVAALLIVGPLAVSALSGTKKAFASEAVVEDGVLRIPALDLAMRHEDIRQGMETGADGRVLLDLVDNELLRIDFGPTAGQGERLLATLGVGAEQRTMTVPLRGQIGWFVLGLCTFLLSFVVTGVALRFLLAALGPIEGGDAFAVMVALPGMLAAGAVRRFGKPHVIVGADGIRLRGTLRQPFIPYSDIKDVVANGWYVVLHLVSGKRLTLPLIQVDATRIQSLTQRIEQGRRRAASGAGRLSDSLRRAGRSLAEWKTALVALSKREATFREAPVDHEEVIRIANDPGAGADERVAATFVLREMDPRAAPRIRIATDATADEELRAALLEAADGALESDAVERVAKRQTKGR